MSWRKRKEILWLTNLLSFSLGIIFLLLSKHYFTSAAWVTLSGLLGAYLTISVIVNLFHKTFLRPSEEEERRKEIEILLDSRINDILVDSTRYGFAGFVSEIDFKGLFDHLKKADELWWLDTYAPGHKLWIENLREAVQRGAKINMLVINPDSDNTNHRADEIGGLYARESFKSELRSFIHDLSRCMKEKSKESGTLELRLYSDLPSVPMYVVSRNNTPTSGYTSFFLGKPTGVAFHHMLWKASEVGMLNHFYKYLKDKWKRNEQNAVECD